MASLAKMIDSITGLRTADVSEWENGFIQNIDERTEPPEGSKARNTTLLSDKQVEVIERIYNKHFAD